MVFVVGVNESWNVAESDESGAAPPVCVAVDEASEAGNILDARRSALSPYMSVCTVQEGASTHPFGVFAVAVLACDKVFPWRARPDVERNVDAVLLERGAQPVMISLEVHKAVFCWSAYRDTPVSWQRTLLRNHLPKPLYMCLLGLLVLLFNVCCQRETAFGTPSQMQCCYCGSDRETFLEAASHRPPFLSPAPS